MPAGGSLEVKDTFEFDTVECNYPSICHVSGDIYAITYEGADYHGKILTVTITAAGAITEPATDTWTYSVAPAARYHPRIFHATGNIYLHATRNNGNSTVVSFAISPTGTITESFSTPIQLDAGQCRYYDLIHVFGSVYAVTSQYPTSVGYMDTFSCDAAGNLALIDNEQMSVGVAFEYARIIELAPNYFVMCYRHTTTGRIAVAHVTVLGAITRTDEQAFRTNDHFIGHCPCQKVTSSIIVVASALTTGTGIIQTIEINAAGVVTNLIKDSYEFDAAATLVTDLVTFGANYYGVIYKGADLDGYIKTFHVADDGTITEPYLDTLEFDGTDFHIGKIGPSQEGACFVVVYEGPGNTGFIKSIYVEGPPVGVPHHEMMIGMGP